MGIDMEVSKTVLRLMKKQGMDIKLNSKVSEREGGREVEREGGKEGGGKV